MSLDFEFGSVRRALDSNRVWWGGLSPWLKAVYLFGAIPAWLFILYFMLTGQNKGIGAIIAFGVFIGCAILHYFFDPRNRPRD